MRCLLIFSLFALSGCTTAATPPVVPPSALPVEITLEKIRASEVEAMVARHKGKVVAIDVWADFCAPCKKAFPHLVELHKQHAAEGLVCVSLSVDLHDNFDGALAFLKKQGATFPNYILWDSDDNKDQLEKKLPHTAVPIFHVFDRDGKRVKTWEGAIKHDEIDALIKKLLAKE